MAIILGSQICVPEARPRAVHVIEGMERLLEKRRTYQVTRRQFLTQWQKLRMALSLTKDYQELRERVRDRAHGMCEICKRRPGEHVHHNEPVVFAPRKALRDSNCIYACASCHDEEDPRARARALRKRRHVYMGGVEGHDHPSHSSNSSEPRTGPFIPAPASARIFSEPLEH